MNSLEEPKGVAYANIRYARTDSNVADAMRKALGWKLGPVFDSIRRK
jgi:hypothetical protein